MSNTGPKSPESLYAEHFDAVNLTTIQKLKSFARFVPRPQQANYLFKWELFKRVIDVQGSVVELGVYLGSSLFAFANFSAMTEPYNYQRRVIGFDTFEGFPSVSPVDTTTDVNQGNRERGGFWVSKDHYDELCQSAEVFDANRFLNQRQKVELVKGDVYQTIPEYLTKNPHTLISLLYLDLDLYEPTLFALQRLYDRVVPGGVIGLDEVNDPRWPGETTAVLEFFKSVPGRLERMPFEPAAAFFVKK